MLYIILLILVLSIGGVVIFINTAPQFGSDLTKAQKQEFEQKDHFSSGKFINDLPIDLEMSFSKMGKMMRVMANPDPNVVPSEEPPMKTMSEEDLLAGDSVPSINWLGHSSFYMNFDGARILIDPVFNDKTTPVSFFGRKRFYENLPLEADDIENLDIVLISHDHYDHLDYKTIKLLKNKADKFIVPLGVDNHLLKWGVAEEKIITQDWWDETKFGDTQIIFVPTRHFSGRKLGNRYSTLWGGFIIKGKKHSIYFSGDGGYGPHFKEIGDKYGPFDLGLMECGQFNENWSDVHLFPEETVQASVDAGVKTILPVHWGAYTLAPHAWTEPIDRFVVAAKEKEIPYLTPMVGQGFDINAESADFTEWWKGAN